MPILIRNWQWQRPLGRAGRQLQPRAGFAEAVLCLFTQLSAGNREGEKTVEYFFWPVLPLCLCLSLYLAFLFLGSSHISWDSVLFGTSSSFQICPGTFGAVPGMLRTRSVDYRDCTNERIQAVLVSRAGNRQLPLPLSFFTPVFPAPSSSALPQHLCVLKRGLLQIDPLFRAGYQGGKVGSAHSAKLGCPLWLTPQLLHCCSIFCQPLPGGGVWWKLRGCGENQTTAEKEASTSRGPRAGGR